jgi:hypothetical protein
MRIRNPESYFLEHVSKKLNALRVAYFITRFFKLWGARQSRRRDTATKRYVRVEFNDIDHNIIVISFDNLLPIVG